MAEMITGARTYIDAPAVTPLGGGILATANVIDVVGDTHPLMGAQYLTDACGEIAAEWSEWCTMTPAQPKVFTGDYDVVEGDPFAVYAGVSCSLQRLDEGKARAVRRLSFTEGRAVDRHMLALLAAEAVDLTTTGELPLAQAIGVAEAYAAAIYGAVPTIVIPRQLVPCGTGANGPIFRNLDDSLVTANGSKVANATVVPFDAPVSTAATIYVSGQITLLRGTTISLSTPQQTTLDGSFSPTRALAERIYVPLVECFVAKVETTCS